MIIHQMSDAASAVQVEMIERLGKTFTGIGIALLIIKTFLGAFQKVSSFILMFILVSLIGIGFSFLLQNQIIQYIVQNSTNEQRGKALLISAASNTVVPYYNDRYATRQEHLYWWNFKMQLKQMMDRDSLYVINPELNPGSVAAKAEAEREAYFALARSCQQHPNIFNTAAAVDRAFFPYIELTKPFQEHQYKQAITHFSACLLQDEAFYLKQIHSNRLLDTLNNAYSRYLSKSEEYNDYMEKAFWAKQKEMIQQEWIKQSKEMFGAHANIPPNMTERQFFNHKDVKAYIFKETKQNRIYDPKQKDLKAQMIASLPDSVLTTYMKYRPFISELNAQNDKQSRIRMGEEIDARDAYKAIVMPMVGLSFSVFFLIANILSLISMLLFSNNAKFSKIFMIFTLLALMAIPNLKSGPIRQIGAQSSSPAVQYALRSMYYYQNIIMKIYRKD